VNDVNNGHVTEADITNDLAESRPATGFTVIVTVITEATRNSDGSAHFQTFVDVTGDAVPNADQLRDICRGISNSLSTHLGIDVSEIKCELTPRSNKRATTSYVADLTVGQQQTAGAFHVAASLALLASAIFAAI